MLVGISPAKAWEDVPGNKCAEGSVGRDGAIWGTVRPLQSQAFGPSLQQLTLNWKNNKGRIRTQVMFQHLL